MHYAFYFLRERERERERENMNTVSLFDKSENEEELEIWGTDGGCHLVIVRRTTDTQREINRLSKGIYYPTM